MTPQEILCKVTGIVCDGPESTKTAARKALALPSKTHPFPPGLNYGIVEKAAKQALADLTKIASAHVAVARQAAESASAVAQAADEAVSDAQKVAASAIVICEKLKNVAEAERDAVLEEAVKAWKSWPKNLRKAIEKALDARGFGDEIKLVHAALPAPGSDR